jgi:hypothetical protein
MLAKSIMIAYTYLPSTIPFVSQIINAFQRIYPLNKQVIIESEEYEKNTAVKFKIVYLRPIKGVTKND